MGRRAGQEDSRNRERERERERHEYKQEEKEMQGSEERHEEMPPVLSQNACVSHRLQRSPTATCFTLCYSFQELLLIIIRDPNAHDVCTWTPLDIWHISCVHSYRLLILLLVLQSLVTYHCSPYVATSFLCVSHLHKSLPSPLSLLFTAKGVSQSLTIDAKRTISNYSIMLKK